MRKLRQRQLDERLPEGSSLRDYLEGKTETSVSAGAKPDPNLVLVRNPYGRRLKTVLVMPPMTLYEGATKRLIPPLGLCYIAASLRAYGHDVTIIDTLAEGIDVEHAVSEGIYRWGLGPDEFAERLRDGQFDVVGFSMIYSSDLPHLYDYAQVARNALPDAVTIAGGLHASIYAREVLRDSCESGNRPSLDYVLRGEGEHRLPEFLTNLEQGLVDLNQDGLCGWEDGEMFVNHQRETIADLDALPLPAYDLVPLERYFEHNIPFSPFPRGRRVMQLYTSRGCPVGCSFCASTHFAKAYRSRSPESVAAEVAHYIDAYDIDEIQFADDNLTFDRRRASSLFAALKPFGLDWCTPNGTMINTLSEELIEEMAASGMYQITLSLDSGNAETLKNIHHKPVHLDRLPAFLETLNRLGVLIHGTLVVGMPGETADAVRVGFEYALSLPFHSMNVFIAQPIPGSELFERAVDAGKLTYKEAMMIDTARSALHQADIPATELETMVGAFLTEFNRAARERDPAGWIKKYEHHLDRMDSMCIGRPSPNTAAIAAAART